MSVSRRHGLAHAAARRHRGWLIPATVWVTACVADAPVARPDPWREAVDRFRAERQIKVSGEDGWATLVGRYLLPEGETSLGADPESRAVLPEGRAPSHVGTLTVAGSTLTFHAAAGADVQVDGRPVDVVRLRDDRGGPPTVLAVRTLRLHVIQRDGHRYLRVKDREHPARARYAQLTWYPVDPGWRFRARLERDPKTLEITNVLQHVESHPSAGWLTFTRDGVEHRLRVMPGDAGGYFVIFKDRTSGDSTYPAGRFLDTPAPDAEGWVELDFNRAYTPPCGFTDYATCPLPPRENHLAVPVLAGETYAHHD